MISARLYGLCILLQCAVCKNSKTYASVRTLCYSHIVFQHHHESENRAPSPLSYMVWCFPEECISDTIQTPSLGLWWVLLQGFSDVSEMMRTCRADVGGGSAVYTVQRERERGREVKPAKRRQVYPVYTAHSMHGD